jgi:hypothetical protein
MGFGDQGSMENWAVERKKESSLRRNRLKCLRQGTSDRRLNGGVDNYSKNGKAGKRKTTSDSWESSVAAGKAQCVVVNAIDFKTPIDIATWPKHAAVEWLGRQNYSKN